MKRLMYGLFAVLGVALAATPAMAASNDAPAKTAVYTQINGAPVAPAAAAVAGEASGPIQEVGWRARAYRRGYVAPYVAPYGVYRPYVRPYVYGGYAPYSYGGYAPYSYGGYSPYYGTYYRGAYPSYGYNYYW